MAAVIVFFKKCLFHLSFWLKALSSSCDRRVFFVLCVLLVTECFSFSDVLTCVHPTHCWQKQRQSMNWLHVRSSSVSALDQACDLVISLEKSVTMAIGRIIGGVLSSFKKTMFPIRKFCCFSVQYCRRCSVVKYSFRPSLPEENHSVLSLLEFSDKR